MEEILTLDFVVYRIKAFTFKIRFELHSSSSSSSKDC